MSGGEKGRIRAKTERDEFRSFANGRPEEGVGKHLQKLGSLGAVVRAVLACLRLCGRIMHVALDTLGFRSGLGRGEWLTVELNEASQRALASFDGEIGPVHIRSLVVVVIGPDGLVGLICLHLRMDSSAQCLKGFGLRALRKKARRMKTKKQNREKNCGES